MKKWLLLFGLSINLNHCMNCRDGGSAKAVIQCKVGKWLNALNQRDVTLIAYVLPSVIVVKMEINSQLEMFVMFTVK